MIQQFIDQLLAADLQPAGALLVQTVFFGEDLDAALELHQVEVLPVDFEGKIFDLVNEIDGFFPLRHIEQLLRRALLIDAAVGKEQHAVGDLPGEVHLVGHDQHAHIPLRQHPDDRQHLADHRRVERTGRFVEQQHLGLHHQAAADRDALLLSAGEHRRPGVGAGSKAHLGKQIQRLLFCLLPLHAPEPYRRQAQIVHHVHF